MRRRITRRGGLALLVGVGFLALTGCVGDGDSGQPTPADATSAPTSAPAATAPPQAALGPVIWSTSISPDGEPDAVVESFPRDAPVIYAAVEASHLDAGETITATWSINDQPIPGIDATVTIEEETAAGWVTFSLTWEGEALWPVGRLQVAISSSSGASTAGEIPIASNQ